MEELRSRLTIREIGALAFKMEDMAAAAGNAGDLEGQRRFLYNAGRLREQAFLSVPPEFTHTLVSIGLETVQLFARVGELSDVVRFGEIVLDKIGEQLPDDAGVKIRNLVDAAQIELSAPDAYAP